MNSNYSRGQRSGRAAHWQAGSCGGEIIFILILVARRAAHWQGGRLRR